MLKMSIDNTILLNFFLEVDVEPINPFFFHAHVLFSIRFSPGPAKLSAETEFVNLTKIKDE